ncbi:MAG: hypothetical protein ABI861_03505 [Panacibacter sp.]
MAQQKIQLRKIRDFGENFSDTFQYIQQEFKPLLLSFILVAGVFMLLNAIFMGIYQKDAFSFLDKLENGVFKASDFSATFNGMYFLAMGFTLVSITAMRTVIAVYMKQYDESETAPTVQQVWSGFIKYFPKVFLFSIPTYLLIIVGLLFCLLPGIYFMVVFAPFVFVLVSEDASFGDAFGRCFDLVKENFWLTLGIYLVAYIIYSVSSGVTGLVIGLVASAVSYFTTKELSTSVGVLMSILNIVQYIFYIIFFVSVGLHYYNLVETKDGTGLAKRLEALGSNANPNESIEEQY